MSSDQARGNRRRSTHAEDAARTVLATAPLADGAGLILVGELDLLTAPQLNAALAEMASMHDFRLDLSQLTFIDSTGLHALMTFARSRDGSGPLVIEDPSEAVLRTLEIVGFHKHPSIEIRQGHEGAAGA